jgi:serine protease Do
MIKPAKWALWVAYLAVGFSFVVVSARAQTGSNPATGKDNQQANDEGQKDQQGDQGAVTIAPLTQLNLDGGYLGVYLEEVTPERKKELGLGEERGAIVMKVVKDGPADKAGLKENDVVVSFNGRRVDSVMELERLFRETPPGRKVSVEVIRAGNPLTMTATMGNHNLQDLRAWTLPKDYSNAIKNYFPNGIQVAPFAFGADVESGFPFGRPKVGISVEPLSDQLATFFGVKEGHGVLVSEVTEESPAAKAGLRAGDVILSVDNVRVNAISDLRSQLVKNSGQTITMKLIRDHREITVSLKLEKKTGASVLQFDNGGWTIVGPDRKM